MSVYKISASVSEDKGKVRNNNEDNFYLNGQHLDRDDREKSATFVDVATKKINVYAVFDGMGGEELGEEASLIAAEVTKKYHDKVSQDLVDNLEKYISLSIDEANQQICRKMQENGKKRIGATYTSLVLNGNTAQIYNVGDSRAYLFRNGQLQQLSIDDTTAQRFVNIGMISEEQAKTHPDRHKLTQHLGIFNHEMIIEPHISQAFEVNDGDKFLLCSDGLTDMVEDNDIAHILMSSNDDKELSQTLVTKALENGGKDNVTAMVVCIEQVKEPLVQVKKNNIISSILIIFTCIALAICTAIYFFKKDEPQKSNPAVTESILVDKKLEITEGEDAVLEVQFVPHKTEIKLSFKSADETIATVNEKGVVHGVKTGKTVVTVSTDEMAKAVFVTVTPNESEQEVQ